VAPLAARGDRGDRRLIAVNRYARGDRGDRRLIAVNRYARG